MSKRKKRKEIVISSQLRRESREKPGKGEEGGFVEAEYGDGGEKRDIPSPKTKRRSRAVLRGEIELSIFMKTVVNVFYCNTGN